MNLYLVRHAVAVEHGDPAYPNDDDRPLTEKGRRQFRKAAAGFLELVDPPALILTSPLPRAMQTAELLEAAAGGGRAGPCAGRAAPAARAGVGARRRRGRPLARSGGRARAPRSPVRRYASECRGRSSCSPVPAGVQCLLSGLPGCGRSVADP